MFNDGSIDVSNRRNRRPANFAQWYNWMWRVRTKRAVHAQLGAHGRLDRDLLQLAAASATAFDPIAGAGWVAKGDETASGCASGTGASNVSFTTETHFVFEYQGGERFDFSGDDDTWVFVNRKLAVDLGGLHVSETGYFILDSDTDAGADTADGSATVNAHNAYYDGTNYTTTLGSKLQLGLVVGKVMKS